MLKGASDDDSIFPSICKEESTFLSFCLFSKIAQTQKETFTSNSTFFIHSSLRTLQSISSLHSNFVMKKSQKPERTE